MQRGTYFKLLDLMKGNHAKGGRACACVYACVRAHVCACVRVS